jgi:alanine racemase
MNDIAQVDVSLLEAGAILSVDLAALARNWRSLQAVCGEAECGAVVKADAYGLGLEAVASALHKAGCKTFFVAHVFEGRKLRAIDPEAAIYVLNGLVPGTAPAYAELNLRPVLNSIPEIEEWVQFCALFGNRGLANGEPMAAALQFDTGLNRLGLKHSDLAAARDLSKNLNLTLVLSHLAWSGPGSNARNEGQAVQFDEMRAFWPDVPASLANSTGIFLDKTQLYQFVRPGYALYGGNPTPGRANPMQAVVRLEARILQLHNVEPGETIGYNGRYTARARQRLAIINIGYADGLPFSAKGTDERPGAEVIVNGQRCPVLGRVSMDLSVIDISHVADAARGTMVELIGSTISIDELAARSETIGYEILTQLGQRFYRRYTRL